MVPAEATLALQNKLVSQDALLGRYMDNPPQDNSGAMLKPPAPAEEGDNKESLQPSDDVVARIGDDVSKWKPDQLGEFVATIVQKQIRETTDQFDSILSDIHASINRMNPPTKRRAEFDVPPPKRRRVEREANVQGGGQVAPPRVTNDTIEDWAKKLLANVDYLAQVPDQFKLQVRQRAGELFSQWVVDPKRTGKPPADANLANAEAAIARISRMAVDDEQIQREVDAAHDANVARQQIHHRLNPRENSPGLLALLFLSSALSAGEMPDVALAFCRLLPGKAPTQQMVRGKRTVDEEFGLALDSLIWGG